MLKSKIAVSGATGFIGRKLAEVLKSLGYHVIPMIRHQVSKSEETIFYDYKNKFLDVENLSKCEAVIHLAGKNIMSAFWTKKVRHELYDSRVKSTKFIAETLANMQSGPKILLNAGAVGIYGDQKGRELYEDSPYGEDFLAKLCIDWEQATRPAKVAGIRVVNMRFGTVLDPEGGILKSLSFIFKLGLGASWGEGNQYMSYVTRNELINQILFVLKNDDIQGPVNMVAKSPITNKEFTKALGSALGKKPFLSIPAFLFKLAGSQGRMMLTGVRAYPRVLEDRGFVFGDENIYQVLRKMDWS